jgi:hypothetical protein
MVTLRVNPETRFFPKTGFLPGGLDLLHDFDGLGIKVG